MLRRCATKEEGRKDEGVKASQEDRTVDSIHVKVMRDVVRALVGVGVLVAGLAIVKNLIIVTKRRKELN